MLRARLDKEHTIQEHRKALDAEQATERQARADAHAAARRRVEADRAAARRGRAGDLERAAVRGLVPIARYTDALAADYDADTVAIMTALVEEERQKYLDQQQRAADAAQRAKGKGLDVGALSQAVLEHVLTIQEFGARLAQLGFTPADAAVLTETLAARLADATAAKTTRDRAVGEAKRRAIDLPRLEQLVRRGVRPIGDYRAQLEALGYDEADRAALVELLSLKIADDQAAGAARAAKDAGAAPGQLTIAQFRRAVLLGLQTPAAFDVFLTTQGLSADEHALIMAELADDLAQADAARQRRTQAGGPVSARELPLDTVRRAARLGIIDVPTYQDRLTRDGYSADDVALETALLLTEIADVQAARLRRDQVTRDLGTKGLTLAELARAVKAGVQHLEAYRAAAVAAGLTADAVDTLTRVLADELTATTAAKARRAAIATTLQAKDVSLAALEDRVRAGALTLDAYYDQLINAGLSPVDAEVLWSLLSDELAAPAARP